MTHRPNAGFALPDLVAVLVMLFVAGCLLVACADVSDQSGREARAADRRAALESPGDFILPHRRAAMQMQNSGQVRGIHTGMVIYAQGNGGYFPGVYSTSGMPRRVLASSTKQTEALGHEQTGLHVQSRFRELLEDRYFTGEYANAPQDNREPWKAGNVRMQHYSYALLSFNGGTGNDIANMQPDLTKPNGAEWSETTNSEAVAITDRAIANGSGGIRSIHTRPKTGVTDWRGSVGWNDGHVTFENDHIVRTRHATARNENDNLFDIDNAPGANAAMGNHHFLGGPGGAEVVRAFESRATLTPFLVDPQEEPVGAMRPAR